MTRRLNNDGTWDDPQAPLATPGLDPYANQIGLRLGGGGVIPFGASALTVGILGDSIVQDGWAYGGVATVSNLVGGSGYVNGTYSNVPLTGGTGAGATANITVAGGAVTSVAIVSPGNAGYQISGILSASNAALGNSGSGFNCYVQTLSAPVLNPVTSMVAGGSTNFVNWAAAYSMGKIRYTAVWAQGGFKVSQILDNLTALYVPFLPDITIVQIGFNDISGVTNDVDTAGIVASFQSSLINLIGKLKALGTTPILCTISPKNSNFGGFNKLNNKWIGIHNQWVRNYCASNRLGMFDYANYVSDPSDTVNGGPFLPLFQGLGGILSFGAITAGSLYTNGTYYGVPMTGGSGTGANANITVAGGAVTSVVVSASSGGSVGRLYNVGDSLTCSAAAIGGTGSGFSVLVGSIGSSHVHGGGELNRALGYELWNGTLSKLATSSYVANYNGLASNGNDTYTYPAGVNLAVGYNTAGTAMLTGTAGTVTGPATGTIPTGLQSWGAAGVHGRLFHRRGNWCSTVDARHLASGRWRRAGELGAVRDRHK
jgi:lysophospholipase L1-like esterase